MLDLQFEYFFFRTFSICRRFEHIKEKALQTPKTTEDLISLTQFMEKARTQHAAALRKRVEVCILHYFCIIYVDNFVSSVIIHPSIQVGDQLSNYHPVCPVAPCRAATNSLHLSVCSQLWYCAPDVLHFWLYSSPQGRLWLSSLFFPQVSTAWLFQ